MVPSAEARIIDAERYQTVNVEPNSRDFTLKALNISELR